MKPSQEQIKFYFCYNARIAEELKNKGYNAITTAINPSSKNTFWLYVRDTEFENTLQQIK